MSIKAAAITTASTAYAVTPTGGTSKNVLQLDDLGNKYLGYIDDGAEFNLRKEVEFEFRRPVASSNAPTGYTKRRTFFTVRIPRICDDGLTRDVDLVRVEIAPSVELSTAEILELKGIAAQILLDSDFDSAYTNQTSA
jgi:hypothetical protein